MNVKHDVDRCPIETQVLHLLENKVTHSQLKRKSVYDMYNNILHSQKGNEIGYFMRVKVYVRKGEGPAGQQTSRSGPQ